MKEKESDVLLTPASVRWPWWNGLNYCRTLNTNLFAKDFTCSSICFLVSLNYTEEWLMSRDESTFQESEANYFNARREINNLLLLGVFAR